MRNLFISQPMNGVTDEYIKKKRDELSNEYFTYDVIDSYFENAPDDATPLWYIGESIKLLGTADLVVFAKGWEQNRGCRIEHACAVAYGLDIEYE